MVSVRRFLPAFLGSVLALVVAGVLASPVLAVGDANEAGCPNEASPGFRSYLPDCRGYELVTPPYKNGFNLFLHAISGDGSRLIATGFGTFAGTPGNSDIGAWYEVIRTPSGWSVSPLNPSGSDVTEAEFAAGTSGLDRSLWVLHSPSESDEENTVYLRGLGGSFTPVGPGLEPEKVAGPPSRIVGNNGVHILGASGDLSHVLFNISTRGERKQEVLWPNDTTVANSSLYEYVGTNNTAPTLVGVVGAAGSANLISQCGTFLGGENDAYGAVSSDGERVVFTPKKGPCQAEAVNHEELIGAGPSVSEVFVREAGSRTVPISQPSPAECEGSSECQSAPMADANFEGASADGSEVFFTSTQMLVPGASEDAVGSDSAAEGGGCSETVGLGGCNLYEYDFSNRAGHNVVLVSGGNHAGAEVQGVARVSPDGTHVYFVAKGVLTSNENGNSETAEAGAYNLYVFERDVHFPNGRTTFIGRLNAADAVDWQPEDRRPVQVTPDGSFLVFRSSADLTSDDTSTTQQIFEYDAITNSLVRVSIGENDYNDNGNTSRPELAPSFPTINYAGANDFPSTLAERLSVSDEGGYVFFSSADALTPQATSNLLGGDVQSVYEYHDGNVHLISSGQDTVHKPGFPAGSSLVFTDSSGDDVFFEESEPLVPQDTDTQRDVYDARRGGGLPPPVSPIDCEGEACQGALGKAPSAVMAGSDTQTGGGNLSLLVESKPIVKSKSKKKVKKKPNRRVRRRVKKVRRSTHVNQRSK